MEKPALKAPSSLAQGSRVSLRSALSPWAVDAVETHPKGAKQTAPPWQG